MNFEYNERSNTWREQNDATRGTFVQRLCDGKNRKSLVLVMALAILTCALIVIYLSTSDTHAMTTAEYDGLNTLQFVSIVFRHGARGPSGTYNTDPYKDYKWMGGWGELTNEGKMQMFHVGEKLRRRYNGFIPADYHPNDTFVQSSAKSRTLMSAYLVLAGLYPPTPEQTWNPSIPWQPIPVYALPKDYDTIIAAKKPCLAYKIQYEKLKRSPEIMRINEKYKDLYANLTYYCNQTMNSMLLVELLYAHLSIQQANGLTLPAWTKGIFPDRMKELPGLSLAYFTFDDLMKRLRGGPLLSEIVTNMNKKMDNTMTPSRKMVLYSGHDLTIVNLWRVLSFEEIILPDFGASLVIEMHNMTNSNNTEIKLFYYNSSSTVEPYRLSMPNCGTPCTLSDFETSVKKYIPDNWTAECNTVI